MFAVFTAFTGAGTLAAGYLSGGSGDYRPPLLLAAAILLTLSITRALWLPTEKGAVVEDKPARGQSGTALEAGKVDKAEDKAPPPSNKLRPRPRRKLWLFALFLALISGAFALTGSFLNVIVKFRLDWADERVSQLLAANGIILF